MLSLWGCNKRHSMRENTSDTKSKPSLLIFIVAFNAEKHIEKVLDRIPEEVFQKYQYEVLIIDDHSADQTFQVVQKYQKLNEHLNLKVLFNPINQGYGGNQKLGYRYALINNFDAVVLLHGDGQYAPEYLPEMVNPIFEQSADAVFGSRMINKKDALKGGMPLYKFVGNIILSRIQNWILSADLSEFHSGYRAYSVKALRDVPFERNSNDFHFDTQIIIQFLISDKKIAEIPIPTFYGDEICHVNGLKYAWNVLVASIQSKLQQLNLYYRLEYDIRDHQSVYSLKLGYNSSHTMALKGTPEGSVVLDMGAGPGLMAAQLKKRGCQVTGIDIYDQADVTPFFNYIVGNLNHPNFEMDLGDFDVILMLDVIEHVDEPEALMDYIRSNIHPAKRPKIILTTPNIAFFILRFQLLFGSFNYGKKGILDRTHKRLFTFATLKRLFSQTGFVVRRRKGIPAPYPEAIGFNWLSRFLLWMNKLLIELSPGLFSYQIYVELEPTPVVEKMLDYSIAHSSEKELELKH